MVVAAVGLDGRLAFFSLSVARCAYMCLWMWTLSILVAWGKACNAEDRLGRATMLVAHLDDIVRKSMYGGR